MSQLKLLIVGGVAAGMAAATRARRLCEDASIIVLERGGYISFANCGLPYYLNRRIPQADKLLVTTPQRVKSRFNIDARIHHEVRRIDRAGKLVHGVRREPGAADGEPFSLPYDKLIVATGAGPIIPPLEHIRSANVFVLRSVEDVLALDQFLESRKPQRAVVVGAGFIGLEMAHVLRERGLAVTVIEKAPHALPQLDPEMAAAVHAELAAHEVKLHTGHGLAALRAQGGNVSACVLEDGREVPADFVLLALGVRPQVELAKAAGLTIGPSGAIAVDALQRTSDPDIYAVGDVAEVVHAITGLTARLPLAGPANRQGRLAGEHAVTGSAPPAGKGLGTAIVQVFDLTVAVTGLSQTQARAAGLPAEATWVYPPNHATYYPGAQSMRLKLIFSPDDGRILGAQACGGAGVDKRIDVIATAMHFGGTIDDLAALDLAYAPQFGAARDPVHHAAMAAQNQQSGLAPGITSAQFEGRFLIDVRTPEEFARGTLPGAINIPVDDLRARLAEIPRNRPLAVFCQVGLRGYIALRILRQQGFADVVNLLGGYSLATANKG